MKNRIKLFFMSMLSFLFLVIAFLYDFLGPSGQEFLNKATKVIFGV